MLEKYKIFSRKIKQEISVYKLLRKHPKTPKLAKLISIIALGYIFLPFDIIPDFIPVIGHVDDFILIPALILLALLMIPKDVRKECRHAAIHLS